MKAPPKSWEPPGSNILIPDRASEQKNVCCGDDCGWLDRLRISSGLFWNKLFHWLLLYKELPFASFCQIPYKEHKVLLIFDPISAVLKEPGLGCSFYRSNINWCYLSVKSQWQNWTTSYSETGSAVGWNDDFKYLKNSRLSSEAENPIRCLDP